MTVSILGPGPRMQEGERDAEGYRTFNVTHLVKSDDKTDGPYTVMNCPGLPLPGAFWAFGNDLDVWSTCLQIMSVRIHEDDGGPAKVWVVTQPFTNKPLPPDKQKCSEVPIEDPLLEPMKVSGGYVKKVVAAQRNRHGQPIKTSSHELIRGPVTEFDESNDIVHIEQNVPVLGIETFSRMKNALNAFPLWGLPVRCIRLSNATWERKYHGLCNVYYTRKFDFEVGIDEAGRSTWDRTAEDEGSMVLFGKWVSATGTGTALTSWQNLNIAGAAPDPSNPAHFQRAVDRWSNPIRMLLNGRGNPADVSQVILITGATEADGIVTFTTSTPHGLIVGDEIDITGVLPTTFNGHWTVYAAGASVFDVAISGTLGTYNSGGQFTIPGQGPGSIVIEKYPETDFLLLGIPLVL